MKLLQCEGDSDAMAHMPGMTVVAGMAIMAALAEGNKHAELVIGGETLRILPGQVENRGIRPWRWENGGSRIRHAGGSNGRYMRRR